MNRAERPSQKVRKVRQEPRRAFLFCASGNRAFAVASVIMDLKRQASTVPFDIILIYDKLPARDRRALSALHEVKFIPYSPPFTEWQLVNNVTLGQFTKLVFAKFELFHLLETYDEVMYLDYDQVIQDSVEELFRNAVTGISMIPSASAVAEALVEPVDGFEMDRDSICASVIVVNRNLRQFREIHGECYRLLGLHGAALRHEQPIFDFILQRYNLRFDRIDPATFCCYPDSSPAARSAKILHAWGAKKFWNGLRNEQWEANYMQWKLLGGKSYKTPESKPHVGIRDMVKRFLGMESK